MEISKLYALFQKSSGVCTDTRKINSNSIYFALKGNNFNGNTFATQALDKGASFAVVDEPIEGQDPRLIQVDDVLKTLQTLANFHRRTFDIPFIAITGSNGKTTTKELVSAVLKKKYKVYATQGNLNNHIGIPLTLLAIPRDTEIAIIEMGANHQKEIASYCVYTEPNYGLITNIGKAHLEGFGGIEGVRKGKGELYDYLLANAGKIFLCTTNATLMDMSKFSNPITYPQIGDFYTCKFLDANPYIRFETKSGIISTQLAGAYNFDNIAVALCIGKYFEIDEKLCTEAVSEYDPQNNRSQITKTNHNALIVDCYNANPTSMKAAIESFSSTDAQNKALILGDMYELGEDSMSEHQAIGELIKTKNFTKVFLCGKEMKYAHQAVGNSIYFEDRSSLLDWFKQNKLQGYTILIKGSRAMALEKILEYL